MSNPRIPYILIKAYDRIEAPGIVNRLPTNYFAYRESGTCDILIAGGVVVQDRKSLRRGIRQLKEEVQKVTSLSYSIMKSGRISLKPCRLLLETGELSNELYYYLPIPDTDTKVGVFSLLSDGTEVDYLTWGTLIDKDTASIPFKFIF